MKTQSRVSNNQVGMPYTDAPMELTDADLEAISGGIKKDEYDEAGPGISH